MFILNIFKIHFVFRMLKNTKKLEENQQVKVKIIEAKNKEIARLKENLKRNNQDCCNRKHQNRSDSQTDDAVPAVVPMVFQNISVFFVSPRELISQKMDVLKNYLLGEREDRERGEEEFDSWTGIAVTTSAKILGTFLSKIF